MSRFSSIFNPRKKPFWVIFAILLGTSAIYGAVVGTISYVHLHDNFEIIADRYESEFGKPIRDIHFARLSAKGNAALSVIFKFRVSSNEEQTPDSVLGYGKSEYLWVEVGRIKGKRTIVGWCINDSQRNTILAAGNTSLLHWCLPQSTGLQKTEGLAIHTSTP